MPSSTLDEVAILRESFIVPQSLKTKEGQGHAGRMRAYLEVPEDGSYTFWVSSRSPADLSMNTTGWDPGDATLLLEAVTSDKTNPIRLEKGTRYYIELFRSTYGKGHEMSISWSRGSNENEAVLIPVGYLIPVGKPVSIIPMDDVVYATVDAPLVIDALGNDQDYRYADPSNSESLHLHYAGQTENGRTELINQNQQILYTPNPGFRGIDKFQYGIQSNTHRDGMQVGSITVHVE